MLERHCVDHEIERFGLDLLRRGYIQHFRQYYSLEFDVLNIDVYFHVGRARHYRITSHELVNGGQEAIRYWLRTVYEDVRSRVQRVPNQHRREYVGPINIGDWWKPQDEKAEARSEALFMLACGKEAFETLKSGKPLPLTGNNGTKYTLHKRSTYCVERDSDHSKLCAVVPGVPLWDHLLGIKLMIEHDEQKFIETANVAHAYSS